VSATRSSPAVVPAAIVIVAAIALGAAWLM
jgi:hypothetical protein